MKKYICLSFLLFILGCANVLPPTGGPKDLLPPKLIASNPEIPAINFDDNLITLSFDEYVQLKNPSSIQIYPRCEPKPTIRVKGKDILIELNCDLDTNTTYTVNFGPTISDLNEGNTLNNFKFVFSESEALDSLFISGSTINQYLNTPISGVFVGLFQTYEDAMENNPYYYTLSDQSGDFEIENIKEGEYYLFSFLDKNNNLRYDNGEFGSRPLSVSYLKQKYSLNLFDETVSNTIKSIENINKYAVEFNHGPLEDSIIILNTQGLWSQEETGSIFWFEDTLNFIKYEYRGAIDSVAIYNTEIPKMNIRSEINYEKKEVIIYSNVPIKHISPSRFFGGHNTDSLSIFSCHNFQVKIPIIPNGLQNKQLKLKTGAITSNYMQQSDSIEVDIRTGEEKFGSVKVTGLIHFLVESIGEKLETNDLKEFLEQRGNNIIVELFDDNTISQKAALQDSILFEWVAPGNYQLRVFLDANRNKFWDPGPIYELTESERIHVYPDVISVRPNWEFEITIKATE